jgi:hypothetical protein
MNDSDSAADKLAERVTVAANSIRELTYESRAAQLPDGCLAAPDVYGIVGAAAELASGLPQALTQLAQALHRSLTVFDVYDSDRQPADSVNATMGPMSAAAAAFATAARHLSDAQNAIANQGVNDDAAGGLRRRPTQRLAPPSEETSHGAAQPGGWGRGA